MNEVVEFEYLGEDKSVAVARLTREKSLNSLLLETIDQLSEKITGWLADDNIACILLDSSSERAFCAGADIVALYHSIVEAGDADNPYADSFFLNEYKLDYAIQTAEKPIVVWGNGIVMGGGLGLLGGCSHRIGTRTTRIAMPEISIGLFPDAGGTRFLSEMPDNLGLFAGLTGCQLSAGDALSLNLLDVVVEQGDKSRILEALSTMSWAANHQENKDALTRLINGFSIPEDLPLNLLRHKKLVGELMLACEAGAGFFDTFEEGLNKFPEDDWLTAAVGTFRNGSPTTARIFVEQMRRAKNLSLEEMFQMELVIAYQCVRHPDFPEGVRALMVDKDKNPDWKYKSTAEVPEGYVRDHFQPSWSGTHPFVKPGY